MDLVFLRLKDFDKGPVGDKLEKKNPGKSCSLFCLKTISDKFAQVRNYS